ncbi:hypothetical protein QFC20_002675 [Naganishia adeliensis]|uniref:Uncharacterized protein n=1 Tax=Naganishia adeliensis TaxID=92952 RepID=A0ACC2WJA7_9TREE|nr:hypothetical protein QFC20_002675 [Naganishia adeliensis]
MSAIDYRFSNLAPLKDKLKTFDEKLRWIRELCHAQATRFSQSDLIALNDSLAAPSASWDAHFAHFSKSAEQFERKISKVDERRCEEAPPFLRAAYLLFAQAEYVQGRRSDPDVASIILRILEEPKIELAEWARPVFAQPTNRMRSCLKDARMKPGNGAVRLFEADKTLDSLEITVADDIVSIVTHGREYSITGDWPDVKECSQFSGLTECSRCEVQAREKDLHALYRREDFDFDAKTVKTGANALCWTTMSVRSSWAAGSTIGTVRTGRDGEQSLAAQTIC